MDTLLEILVIIIIGCVLVAPWIIIYHAVKTGIILPIIENIEEDNDRCEEIGGEIIRGDCVITEKTNID